MPKLQAAEIDQMMERRFSLWLFLCWLLCLCLPARGDPPKSVDAPAALAPLVVTATRSAQSSAALPISVDLLAAQDLQASPELTVDETLREVAAFSLFRRSSSLTANPTAQGVSLRGIGPSGASRSLVLLDGVPLNDPFGGWVNWEAIPAESLAYVEIVHGGGSGAWGNAALGGTIQLFSAPPVRTGGELNAYIGDFDTRRAEFSVTQTAGAAAVRVEGDAFATDGFYGIDPAQRGPVDRPLNSSHQTADVQLRLPVGSATTATVSGRFFEEKRGNGTVLQNNTTDSDLVALALAGHPERGEAWSANLYVQRGRFASFFSSVNATRTAETPANDQYDVPATALGGSLQRTWRPIAGGTTTAGGDARWVEGETREDYLYTGDHFTRQRFAGGDQLLGGAFLNHDQKLGEHWHATLALRADYWRNYDGHRRESNLATGALTRNDAYSAADGGEFSPELGAVWQPTSRVRIRAAAYHAFRVPTLNEYYRPYRVGNTSVEANPALKPESLDGGEVGVDFTGRASRLGLTAFTDELHDAVGNVTLASTPALISQQRQNIDRVRVRGLEATAEWRPEPALRLHADWLLSDAIVQDAPNQPALAGLQLAQDPRQTLTAGAEWTMLPGWSVNAQMRYTGQQFEDDKNTLPLAPATTVDLRVSRRFGSAWEVYAAVENAFDARVETGRSADGVFMIGPPRLARAGARFAW